MQDLMGNLTENKAQLLRNLIMIVIAIFIFGSCLSTSRNSLPPEVHELIDRQYVHCVNVRGSAFKGGNQVESECSSVRTQVTGEGTIPPGEKARGITRAICYHIEYENPYFWAPSQTQYEEIDFAKRTTSKVAVLQNDQWVIFPDQDSQDHERWEAYSCPGEFGAKLED